MNPASRIQASCWPTVAGKSCFIRSIAASRSRSLALSSRARLIQACRERRSMAGVSPAI